MTTSSHRRISRPTAASGCPLALMFLILTTLFCRLLFSMSSNVLKCGDDIGGGGRERAGSGGASGAGRAPVAAAGPEEEDAGTAPALPVAGAAAADGAEAPGSSSVGAASMMVISRSPGC